jgi:uncharacterized protein (TIGR02611 family)
MTEAEPTQDVDPTPDGSGTEASRRERRERLAEAAIAAELATGRREPTVEAARSSIVVRLGRIAFGSTLLIVGLICLVLPGPGLLLIAGGLAVLARDIAWAERLLRYVRRKVPGVTEDEIPRRTIVISVVLMLLGAAVSVWWSLLR